MTKKKKTEPKTEPTLAAEMEQIKPTGIGPAPGGFHRLRMRDRGDGWKVFGAVSDNHLGSKHYRADVLNDLYDWYAREGVRDVFNGGNWIEGQSKKNQHDIEVFGMDNQLKFMIDNYPRRDGITTHYVAGDDHEGWYQQREIFSIGRTLQDRARSEGRKDLHYLGYVEADIELVASRGSTMMRLMHGGGGGAYAISYKPQKILASLSGGEKPAVLLLGHYHKLGYFYMRNVHAVLLGCTENQSIFMRKNSLEAHIGGWLIHLRQAKDGAITDFLPHLRTYFDEGYYERRYDP